MPEGTPRPKREGWIRSLVLVLPLFAPACGGHATPPDEILLDALRDAEDARGLGPAGLTPIMEALASPESRIQVAAVRALGRLESPAHLGSISPLLASQNPDVRAEAVNALGQAVFNAAGDTVARLLRGHLRQEADPTVRGAVGRTLGRLRFESPGGEESAGTAVAAETLAGLTLQDGGDAPPPALLGAVMGLESLTRRNRGLELPERVVERLVVLTAHGLESGHGDVEDAPRVRRASLMALTNAGRLSRAVARNALADPDPEMRRLALAALGRGAVPEVELHALEGTLRDGVPRVRTQAILAYAARASDVQRCRALLEMAADPHPQVAITALDLLGRPCPERAEQIGALKGFVEGEDAATPTGWHRGAHALVALSELSPADASPFLDGFVHHTSPFARAWAARAAGRIPDAGALEALASDPDPNVRTAAVEGLFRLKGHDADDILLAQLDQDDPQLLLTVAGLLEGTPNPGDAVPLLLETLRRISTPGWETLRDPRMAIIEGLAELAEAGNLAGMEAYLSDYDPVVAEGVARLLSEKTSQPVAATPHPAPRAPLPSGPELDRLARSRVLLEMEGGGTIEIRLFPEVAPTNAARFARLAESGVFDGLTFHRVVANFVVQGLSPNANEMAGHGAYSRDEVGLQSNWRGTVGTSTRGRDTGDGQIFINLVDNLRLDHDYTLFGEVVAGMEVVDGIVEGQRVLRAHVEGI